MLRIEQGTIDAMGGNAVFAQMVTDYANALAAHALTVNVPAPVPPNSLVSRLVREHASQYTVFVQNPDAPQPIPDDPRIADLKADQLRTDMLTRLKSMSAAEIDAWLQANMTTIASARVIIGGILKLLATNLNTNK